MDNDFNVERVALHLINKKDNKLNLSDHEIDLGAFKAQEDIEAVRNFFSGHLRVIWDAAESNTVRAAKFSSNSEVRGHYNDLKTDSSQFLQRSRAMAESLFSVAPSNSSSGLLMALWLKAAGDRRQSLALFKMDPGRADKIALGSNQGGILLDLAVRHIEQALPDPGDRVLKWAVTPNPDRQLDVKIKDIESKGDPTKYFMTFLGCEQPGRTVKQQVNDVLGIVPAHAVVELSGIVNQLPNIDVRPLSPSIKQSKVLTEPQKAELSKKLGELENLGIPPQAIQTARLGYRLSNSIVIKGPLAAMQGVKILRVGKNNFEFRVTANDYKVIYE